MASAPAGTLGAFPEGLIGVELPWPRIADQGTMKEKKLARSLSPKSARSAAERNASKNSTIAVQAAEPKNAATKTAGKTTAPKKKSEKRRRGPNVTSKPPDGPPNLGPEPRPPVVGRPLLLPLASSEISWERFENFCRAFVSRLPGVVTCNHYGKQGNAQRGIDLVAETKDGTRTTYQCRQVISLSGPQVKKLIRETTFPASKHVILTSAVATATARDEVDRKKEKWLLWDVTDISEHIHDIPGQHGSDLVQRFFGSGWRQAFLNAGPVRGFRSTEDTHASLFKSGILFHHAHAIFGRSVHLDALRAAATADSTRLVLTEGKGGIGKTRVLIELARQLEAEKPDRPVFWLEESVPLTDAVLNELPGGPITIIVDDAHRRDDLGLLLAAAQQQPHWKLLLGTRPHATERLLNELPRAKFNHSEVAGPIVIAELKRDDIESVIRSILGSQSAFDSTIQRIARIADGSPLVATVAAMLVRSNSLSPELVQEDVDFERAVFARFEDVLIGQATGDHGDAELYRELVAVIAALTPFPIHFDSLVERVAKHLRVTPSRVRLAIGELEHTGIVVRREYAVRITPDVLADHILRKRSLTHSGDTTGYAAELVREFGELYLSQLVRNFAELDWRTRQTREAAASSVDAVWGFFEQEFWNADRSKQGALLQTLEDVAYFEPGRSLSFLKAIIASTCVDLNEAQRKARDQRYIRILSRISYTTLYLADCADGLIHLASHDPASAGQAGSASAALAKLAEFEMNKPHEVQAIVLDVLERHIAVGDFSDELALRVLKPMLAKGGIVTASSRSHVTFGSFAVRVCEPTTGLRRRVRDLLSRLYAQGGIRARLRVAALLCEDVGEPIGMFGHTVSEEARLSWLFERLASLDLLLEILRIDPDAILLQAVAEGLRWHWRHGKQDDIRRKADQIRVASQGVPEYSLLKALRGNCFEDIAEFAGSSACYEAFATFVTEQARAFIAANDEPAEGLRQLAVLGSRIAEWTQPNIKWFLEALSQIDPGYTAKMFDEAIASENDTVVSQLSSVFRRVREADADRAKDWITRLLSGQVAARFALAQALGVCSDDLQEYEHAAWVTLLSDRDQRVRHAAMDALRGLVTPHPKEALELALGANFDVEPGSNDNLVDDLCALFWNDAAERLDDPSLLRVLAIMERVRSISGHWVERVIGIAAKRLPRQTVAMLIRRAHKNRGNALNYDAVPYQGLEGHIGPIADMPEYEHVLNDLCDFAKSGDGEPFATGKLFRALVRLDRPAATGALRDYVQSGKVEDIQFVADAVKSLPGSLLLEAPALMIDLLRAARVAGDKCFQAVVYVLRGAVVPTSWQSQVGVADGKHVALERKARAVAASLADGSVERRFFEEAASAIADGIQRHLARDEVWVDEDRW